MIERNPREPCQLCGAPLFYHEQQQSLCRACATANGITRLCDRPTVIAETIGRRLEEQNHELVADMLAREGFDHPMCRCYVAPETIDKIAGDALTDAASSFYGIDRSVAPALISAARPDPLTIDDVRRGMRALLERKPAEPVKIRITRAIAEYLRDRGVSLEWYVIID